ncbi:reductive dehalogenase [Dehalococcoides sp. THU3]|nr:reductive dehalogenase [Dehalococcoides sp. UCH007]BAQ35325.1 putative reductive dehalogenase [Dehalococcoides sp. UCH007]
MSKFHSTLSRRDFVKALGLSGAGLGLASAAAPAFHDLDELMPSADNKVSHPWWVKQREHGNPTIEVDWNMLTPSHSIKTGMEGFGYPSPYPGYLTHEDALTNPSKMDQTKPGYRMEDYALFIASMQRGLFDHSIDETVGPPSLAPQIWNADPTPDAWPDWGNPGTPKFKKVPRWSGTPEEASRMITAAAHYFGAYKVGFLEVDDKVKKLTFADSTKWADCDEPYATGEVIPRGFGLGFPAPVHVFPNKMKYVIVLQVTQPHDTMRILGDPAQPGHMQPINGSSFALGYNQRLTLLIRMQAFLKVLGYLHSESVWCYNTGGGALAGINEIGRHGIGISPELGSAYRVNLGIFTDLPVVPTPPIDGGMTKFCETCGVCADLCPNEAINKDKEPTWDIFPTKLGRPEYGIPAGTPNTWSRPGVKNWHVDYVRCRGCSYCQGYCVFSQQNFASMHNIIKSTISNTTLLNKFFADSDRLFGYSDVDTDYDGWWNRDSSSSVSTLNYARLLGR